jgi:prolyl-tRNA editing enzyme YbaK/EbsC (Cys-tRNA(Pro) deacylase)
MTLNQVDLPEPTRRCLTRAHELGVKVELKMFDVELPTAKAAASALKIHESQITNSLVFEIKSGQIRLPVLVCSAGDRRVDVKKLAAILGVSKNKIKSSSAASVLEFTGFEAGGVGPCGFLAPFHASFVDENCFNNEELWCGGGVKRAMLRCSPAELLTISGGIRADLAEDSVGRVGPSVGFEATPHGDSAASMSELLVTALSPPPTAPTAAAATSNDQPASLHRFEDQLVSCGDGTLRWFPERAFDFPAGSGLPTVVKLINIH